MIKTLRITTIVAAILAVVFFVLSALFGLRHEKDKEAFLAKPSATDVFKKNAAVKSGAELESPLIKQARAFELRINPPKPKEEGPVTIAKVIEIPKFKLLGTSFVQGEPNKSTALIDEPGKGMHWIMASDKIDYLTVVRIEDGKIVYTDGKKEMEMLTEKPPEMPGIVVIPAPGAQAPSPASGSQAATEKAAALRGGAVAAAGQEETPERTSAEDVKANAEFIKKLMAEAQEANATGQSKETGITKEEANGLKDLGEFLKKVEQEANSTNAEPNNAQK